ncbi:MAG: flagellar hook-associated protein FlgK [Cellvibrionaceae bacterium]
MGILSNAISGLQASQQALRTAGHNISNANTQGYSRQQVEFGTRPPESIGIGFMGTGVTLQNIERVVSEFMTAQVRSDTTSYHELQKFDNNINSIDNLVADAGTGLSGSLQSFFAALQIGADEPASSPARRLIISEADGLSSRFNLLHDRLETLETGTVSDMRVLVSEVNSLANSIAGLNKSIQQQMGQARGVPPNDLLDKRDEQLRQLSELISIQVIEQDEGNVNIMIGNGQPLVVSEAVSQLTVNNQGQLFFENKKSSFEITDAINGGEIGGLLRFRDDVLAPAVNELGRMAIVIADEFNKIQEQGLDLEGDYGSQFFYDINDPDLMMNRAFGDIDNTLPDDRILSVEISDPSQLTLDDYSLRILPNTQNYIVTRESDGSEVTQGILSGAFPESIQFEGVTVHLENGSFQGGDEFTIQPTRSGASDFETIIERPEDIAYASPLRTITGQGNIGQGVVSAGEMLSFTDIDGNVLPAFSTSGELNPPVVVRFTSPTTYDVLDNSNPLNPQDLDPPIRNQSFIPGSENFIFSNDQGATQISGNGQSLGLPNGSAISQTSGGVAANNQYPAELYTFTTTDPNTGISTSQRVTTSFNASAAETATLLSSVPGVQANAFTEAVITDLNISNFNSPAQITLNGQALIGYDLGAIASDVPDPNVDESAFNDYLATQINANPTLNSQGFFAVSATNPQTGNPELRLQSSSGVDADIRFEGVSGDTISVNDSVNPNVRLTAGGAGVESLVTVGGVIDLTLGTGVEMESSPSTSQLFGDSTSAAFALDVFFGYQVSIKGEPATNDTFSIEFNSNATSDNRNALRFVDMETKKIVANDTLTLSGSYRHLVEKVGSESSLSKINTEASLALLQETQSSRDSISGVNLDEEAANLVKFEQVYNANARVIAVSRDLFDTLLNAI